MSFFLYFCSSTVVVVEEEAVAAVEEVALDEAVIEVELDAAIVVTLDFFSLNDVDVICFDSVCTISCAPAASTTFISLPPTASTT